MEWIALYERRKRAFALIMTGGIGAYCNSILKKGVISLGKEA
jgi:L-fucose mutarotase/ribose pyranase (RbsD/FucU family)